MPTPPPVRLSEPQEWSAEREGSWWYVLGDDRETIAVIRKGGKEHARDLAHLFASLPLFVNALRECLTVYEHLHAAAARRGNAGLAAQIREIIELHRSTVEHVAPLVYRAEASR